MRPSLRFLHAPLAAALAAAPLSANPFTPTAAIDAAVAGFLGAAAGTPGGAARGIDPRMKLAACADALDVAWYGRAGTTLQVSCPSRGWRVYVPVGSADPGSARAGLSGQTLVQRGETVSLVYEGPGFTLTRQGEALEAGARDQWIKIRPVGDSPKPVSGQVVSPGTVRVSAG